MLIFLKKIKIVSICILVFQSILLFSQYYTTGYFPSLKNIYMNEGNGEYKGLPLDFSRLKLQKNYNRIQRYTPETKNFLGKFKISRIVFSKRHERAYFEYHKSDSTSLDKFEINYIVAAKEQGVWKVKRWSGYSTK